MTRWPCCIDAAGVKVVGEQPISFEHWLFTDACMIQDAGRSVPGWWENYV